MIGRMNEPCRGDLHESALIRQVSAEGTAIIFHRDRIKAKKLESEDAWENTGSIPCRDNDVSCPCSMSMLSVISGTGLPITVWRHMFLRWRWKGTRSNGLANM